MSRSSTQSRKLIFSFVLCSFGALAARPASASTCPPGSRGAAPHCQPSQVAPRPTNPMQNRAPSSVAPDLGQSHAVPLSQPRDRRLLGPPVTEPLAPHANAAQTHGIIFVGGKSAINSQPVPPGHAPGEVSINSQPVPPGHAVHQTPRPGTPVEHAHKRRVDQPGRSHR